MNFFRTVKRTVGSHELLKEGDSVLVALSGGPDSVALLHILTRLQRTMKLALTAVYINHQIRKRAAGAEEMFCQQLCDRLGVELDIVSEDIPSLAKHRKKGLEETARDFRYEVFEDLADEDGHDRIALGHHADDRVETVLFRILRGTGITGLAGMPVRRGRIIRPLFEVTKADILAYLKKHRLTYCVDESNRGVDFRRNYIRNRLLVDIRGQLNPQVDRALLGLSEVAGDDDAYLERLTDRAVKKAVTRTPGGKLELDLVRFGRYDISIRRRVLRRCIRTLSPGRTMPDKEIVDRMLVLAGQGGRPVSLPGGLQATPVGGKLAIYSRQKRTFRSELTVGRTLRLEQLPMVFRCKMLTDGPVAPMKKKQARKIGLDWDRIRPPLVVRNIRPGDRFRPLGLGGSKKVGDYLTDKKVPVLYRDEIPVVCDLKGIVWLVGYEIDDRVKIDDKTGKVLTIEFIHRKSGSGSTV